MGRDVRDETASMAEQHALTGNHASAEQHTSSGERVSRCAMFAVIGPPNAGKSTLINRMSGSKVAIVTHKAQTTRARLRAIIQRDATQLVLIDTPGLFAPRRRLDEAMVRAAWRGVGDGDWNLLVLDARKGLDNGVEAIIDRLSKQRNDCLLILNKIDRMARPKLLALSQTLNGRYPFAATFMISALKGDGVEDLLRDLAARAPLGPWLYPADQLCDTPSRVLAAELTREQVLLRLHDEIPYQLTVETTDWQQQADGSVRIHQTIYCGRESHKPMVLGKGGACIRDISMRARKEISQLIGQTVHLLLYVTTKESWSDDPERYRAIGLEFPTKGKSF